MTEQMVTHGSPAGAPARATAGVDELIAAATALSWAAQWDTARALLASAQAGVPGGAAAGRLALEAAATAVHHDFRTAGPRWAPEALAAAETAGAGADPGGRWNLDFLILQDGYGRELTGPDGSLRFGPDGRDPACLAALAARADTLRERAEATGGQARAGWAAFYRGLIADNLIGDPDGAERCFGQALAAGEQSGDDYLTGEALRHLGDHDEGAGDLAQARVKWERSAEVWARIGNGCGVLAQQLLLAHLAIAEGNAAAGVAIATEAGRWAGAAGLAMYRRSADEIIAGQQAGTEGAEG